MTYKWIGAVFVILGCGSCGLSMAAEQRQQEILLHQLMQVLNYMECELQYRLTPLPELCRRAGREVSGNLRQVFRALSAQLDNCASPEVSGCMKSVLKEHRELPGNIRHLLIRLGYTLGRFDLPGQLQGLSSVQKACQEERHRLMEHRDERVRNCRTLAFCAGAALVILFV